MIKILYMIYFFNKNPENILTKKHNQKFKTYKFFVIIKNNFFVIYLFRKCIIYISIKSSNLLLYFKKIILKQWLIYNVLFYVII